ncbi:MAG TPA: monofunctional biosynthetic peptidoglycan transglycosylase [Chthoniobacterales bacterium]
MTTTATREGKKTARTDRKRRKRPFRWLWLLFWACWFVVGFPLLQVVGVRFLNPPWTLLMGIRAVERRLHSGTPAPRLAYEWVRLKEVPEDFLKSVWMMEDQRFFDHDGFDWKEIETAMADAKRTGKPVRGASTISMQCARSLFLWQGRSWIRKPLEAYYTMLMETVLTKRRILELYVNVIETGDGIYGIEAAARNYYGKSARDLTRAQSAMIAAILPAPRTWDPLHPTKRVERRQEIILHRIRDVSQEPWQQ